MAGSSRNSNNSTTNLGFEAKLWLAADTFYFTLSRFGFLSRLAPHGMAGFVPANGSMSSNQSGEAEIPRGGYRHKCRDNCFCRFSIWR